MDLLRDSFKGREWVDEKKMNLFPFVAAWFMIDLSGFRGRNSCVALREEKKPKTWDSRVTRTLNKFGGTETPITHIYAAEI